MDILICPFGPLLRGGDKADLFAWTYQQALEVVEFGPDAIIQSIEDLERKHFAVLARRPYRSLPEYGETVR
ncbi:MAG: hypothetical protein ABSG91_08805 [Syntrophobacteraceae bacterium]